MKKLGKLKLNNFSEMSEQEMNCHVMPSTRHSGTHAGTRLRIRHLYTLPPRTPIR